MFHGQLKMGEHQAKFGALVSTLLDSVFVCFLSIHSLCDEDGERVMEQVENR